MEFLNKKQKTILAIIGSIMLVFIGYYILNKTNYSEEIEFNESNILNIEDTEDKTEKQEQADETDEKIIVHITGEVESEGIVEIEKESRLVDVIKEAGGTTEDADLSKINLAYEVKDGQKIYIPSKEEEIDDSYITEEAGDGVLPEEQIHSEKVNINTAKQTELETISGIGPSTALKIINYRDEHGEFKSIEEIQNVPGIGEAKFESIKDSICV